MATRSYGEYKRTVARLNVVRGYHGNETTALSAVLPPKDDEGIKSGMIISQDGNGEWVKGCPAGKEPYMAWHDQADPDVASSGKLLGLSCAGDYVFETGWFQEVGGSITSDHFLKASTTAQYLGYVENCDITDDADKVGKVHVDGVIDYAGKISGVTKTNGAVNMLKFVALWQPNQAPGVYGA